MIWPHITSVTSSANPPPHSLHFTHTGPFAVLLTFLRLPYVRPLPWLIPLPEICFHLLFSQLTFTSQGDFFREGYAWPLPSLPHLIFEVFLVWSLFAHYYTYAFTNSESIISIPMEDSEWQNISLLNTDLSSLEELGTWQQTKKKTIIFVKIIFSKGKIDSKQNVNDTVCYKQVLQSNAEVQEGWRIAERTLEGTLQF